MFTAGYEDGIQGGLRLDVSVHQLMQQSRILKPVRRLRGVLSQLQGQWKGVVEGWAAATGMRMNSKEGCGPTVL